MFGGCSEIMFLTRSMSSRDELRLSEMCGSERLTVEVGIQNRLTLATEDKRASR